MGAFSTLSGGLLPTASSSFYAPIQARHVTDADGLPITFFTRGSLPYLGPDGEVHTPEYETTVRHRLAQRHLSGGYLPDAIATAGAEWTSPLGGHPPWLRLDLGGAKCITSAAVEWVGVVPSSFLVTFVFGPGATATQPSELFRRQCDGNMTNELILHRPHNTTEWTVGFVEFIQTQWVVAN